MWSLTRHSSSRKGPVPTRSLAQLSASSSCDCAMIPTRPLLYRNEGNDDHGRWVPTVRLSGPVTSTDATSLNTNASSSDDRPGYWPR